MDVYEVEGKTPVNVRCVRGCGFGKRLASFDTQGLVSEGLENQLIDIAIRHEEKHPKHSTEVRLYRLRVNFPEWTEQDSANFR